MAGKYKAFPPFVGHIKVPVSSQQAALAAAAMYAPARRVTSLLRRASLAYLKLAGPRLLPGVAQDWTPPMENEIWSELFARLGKVVGPIDDFAIYERRQSIRSGFTLLLLRRGSPVAYVRVVRELRERVHREYDVLGMLRSARPLQFRAPEPIACGDLKDWSYLVTSAVLLGEHRVAKAPPLEAITRDIQRALLPLSRPVGTPPHWLPMHGDLQPVNLRDSGDGQLVLLDWESVKWGPPGADEVMYRATEAVLTGRHLSLDEWPEAKEYWRARLARPGSRSPKVQAWTTAMQRLLNA